MLLTETGKISFDFEAGEDGDPAQMPAVGKCPKCAATVRSGQRSYFCEQNSEAAGKKCDFQLGKKLLDRELAHEEVAGLLDTGKTALLDGFVSRRNKRKFSAYLTVDQSGKIGFEFEPRKKPAGKSAAKKKSAKAKPRKKKAAA